METLERLGADHLRAAVLGYRDALRAHEEALNRLNVYPVPDGDTGTNMALTLESVVAELDGADDMATACKAIRHGSLMGARGNSGVILSQVLRGLAETLAEAGQGADGALLAEALRRASEAAYKAVGEPVEGTILTVVRRSAEEATAAAGKGGSLAEVLKAAGRGAHEALEKTPELLPVLARAGVVDAGGAGFVLLLDVLLHLVDGRPLPEPEDVPAPASSVTLAVAAAHSAGEGEAGVGDLRYEVMFLLDAPDEAIPAFRKAWAGVGGSIAVVGGEGVWNCHIHTDDIGAAVEAGIEAGRPRAIRVTDLHEQMAAHACDRPAPEQDEGAADTSTTAVVAVASGAGVEQILRSLGVQVVVPGGQSMNPSTAQILDAVKSVDPTEVVVLPNNDNVMAAAEQAAANSDKQVRVVRNANVVQAFAALLSYDPGADADANSQAMTEAAGRVAWGEVTRAVRDAPGPHGPIRAGDWLGLTAEGVAVVARTAAGAACALLDRLAGDDHELVTLVEGEGAEPEGTEEIRRWLAEHRPHLDVEVHAGGQPLYPYLVGVE